MNKDKILSKIHITVEAVAESEHPKYYFTDTKDVEDICELARRTEWGWCTVKVTAKWNSIEHSEFCGACSYESEDDFIKNSGYFEDMKREAIDCLFAELSKIESDMY